MQKPYNYSVISTIENTHHLEWGFCFFAKICLLVRHLKQLSECNSAFGNHGAFPRRPTIKCHQALSIWVTKLCSGQALGEPADVIESFGSSLR